MTKQHHLGSGDNVLRDKIVNTIVGEKRVVDIRLLGNAARRGSRTDKFTGREDDLENIQELVASNQTVLILNGIGGIGKTTLAKKFVSNEIEGKKYQYICWIDYQGSLQDSFISQIDHDYDPAGNPLEVLYRKIISDLSSFEGEKLLIIDGFDNTDDEKNIATLPVNFHTLITSRHELKAGGIKLHKLETLAPIEAKALFYKHWYHTDDGAGLQKLLEERDKQTEQLDELLEKIGYHTLTIEIMAKTLAKKTDLGLVDLLALKGKINIHTENPKTEETTLDLFLSQLFDLTDMSSAYEKKSLYLLKNLAVLPSVDLGQGLIFDLLQIKDKEQDEYINALDDLADRGWLKRTFDATGHPERLFRCHQIIQAFIWKQEKYKPTFADCCSCVDSLGWKLYVESGDNPLDKAVWMPFAVAVLEGINDLKDDIATLANNLGQIYKDMGDFRQALEYTKKALDIREQVLAKNHPDLSTSYSNLGIIYRLVGDIPQALQYAKKALDIREQVLAKNHPSLAISYDNIGLIYHDMGDIPQALEFAKKALKIFEKELPEEHPDLAISYDNIGQIYRVMGDLSQALEFAKKALKIREQILAKNHPGLATSYNNLASIYFDIQDYYQAKVFIRKAIVILQKNFPDGHPDLDNSLRWQEAIEEQMGWQEG